MGKLDLSNIPPLDRGKMWSDLTPTSTVEALIVDGTSGDPAREAIVARVLAEAFELWKTRHKKYGRQNIAMFGEVGCVVRCGDKLARLTHVLIDKKGGDAVDESVTDSFLDLINYGAMGLVCWRKEWA